MNKKLLNQIYNIIFYSFAICSAGYFIISSIQKNEGLKSSDIIYIIFVIALLIPKKKIKFNILRIILLLNLVDIIFYHSFQNNTYFIFYFSYIVTGILFSQEYTCPSCGKKYGWKILFSNKCPHCGVTIWFIGKETDEKRNNTISYLLCSRCA